jgi:DNA-binding IscR family transcriptional regulator
MLFPRALSRAKLDTVTDGFQARCSFFSIMSTALEHITQWLQSIHRTQVLAEKDQSRDQHLSWPPGTTRLFEDV